MSEDETNLGLARACLIKFNFPDSTSYVAVLKCMHLV